MDLIKKIALELNLKEEQVKNTVEMLDDGKTVPFIARYRKELTGSLDDSSVRAISERLQYLRNFEDRKAEIISSITNQDKMTDEISKAIENAETMVELEDIYRPFKQKKKTRASVAKEKGLEPLAIMILNQEKNIFPEEEAKKYIDTEKEILNAEDALNGAMDIIAEIISDDAELRKKIREAAFNEGYIHSNAVDEENTGVYDMYKDFKEPVSKIAGHRVLAINRGEKEKVLKVVIEFDNIEGENICINSYCTGKSASQKLVEKSAIDSYNRLIWPSIEREIRNSLTEKASEGAITVFRENLNQLLMTPPVKNTVTLGFDPGYQHGCKCAVVDETGKVLDTFIVYPTTKSEFKINEAKKVIIDAIKKYKITTIAIGNGTASRESEKFIADILKTIPEKVSYIVVSESGASVYSASKLAAEEFPDFDVSLRSAVSIARRLQDPLAELVKITPESIGVGQYQHDMPKARLSEALKGVVENCVNTVGVDLNTASFSLLSYIAGINSTIAKNIVAYREENGAFNSRKQLLKVPRLGPKAFEQCAGFLRIRDGKNFLDNTSVHPESYSACEELLKKYNFSLKKNSDFNVEKAFELEKSVKSEGIKNVSKAIGIGVPTLEDIIKSLEKPGLDPRDELPPPIMRDGNIMEVKDLKEGMQLTGTVLSVVDFGAFVDIGVHENGLVHISQLSNKFIKNPLDVVKVGQIVNVQVLSVDEKLGRISLTMKNIPQK